MPELNQRVYKIFKTKSVIFNVLGGFAVFFFGASFIGGLMELTSPKGTDMFNWPALIFTVVFLVLGVWILRKGILSSRMCADALRISQRVYPDWESLAKVRKIQGASAERYIQSLWDKGLFLESAPVTEEREKRAICSYCGADNEPGQRNCRQCGGPL